MVNPVLFQFLLQKESIKDVQQRGKEAKFQFIFNETKSC